MRRRPRLAAAVQLWRCTQPLGHKPAACLVTSNGIARVGPVAFSLATGAHETANITVVAAVAAVESETALTETNLAFAALALAAPTIAAVALALTALTIAALALAAVTIAAIAIAAITVAPIALAAIGASTYRPCPQRSPAEASPQSIAAAKRAALTYAWSCCGGRPSAPAHAPARRC